MYPILLGLGLLALTAYYVVNTIITNRRHKHLARDWGCQPCIRRQHKWPFGIDLVKQIADGDKTQTVPNVFETIHAQVGRDNWVQNLFGTDNIVTVEPRNIQALLATQFSDFEIGPQRAGGFDPMLGHGIFTSDGKDWEHSRALLRPQFARDQVADLEVEEHHVQDMMKHLVPNASGWTDEVDLSPLFFRLTLDSATEFLFGQSVNSQVAALPDDSAEKRNLERSSDLDWTSFATAYDNAIMAVGQRGRMGELYWLYNPKSFRNDCKAVHKFADYYVNLALSRDIKQAAPSSISDEEKGGGGGGGKKQKYVFLNSLAETTRDPIELRSQLLNILLAGRDTTAGLLGWVFWSLARDQRVFDKLRSVILSDFGTYENPNDISFAALKGCAYLQYVMSETLRLFPTVPFNSRRAVKDTCLPVGGGVDQKAPLFVAKDHEVNYSVHLMHRRKDLWGNDADEFKPERWVGRKAGWEFLPFNGGPRICLGQQHALTLAGFTIVRMMQRFADVQNEETDPVTRHLYSVTTSPWRVRCKLRVARQGE